MHFTANPVACQHCSINYLTKIAQKKKKFRKFIEKFKNLKNKINISKKYLSDIALINDIKNS